MTLFQGPIRAPLPRDLDWRDQSWRSHPLARGMVGGLYPGAGFRDFANPSRLVTDDGINSLPVVTPSAEMGIAWDFSGSKTATMGNWGNEYWSGTTAQFSITLIIDRFVAGTSCIIAKADSNGMMWEIFDISTSGNLGRLAWYVRGSGGAYLEMITNTPPAGVVHTDRPNVITVSVNMALSGSSRMGVHINSVDVSTSVTESGDMSGGIANNASEIILGYWAPDGSYYWPGKLGGVWFHDHALSALEIQILHGQTTRYSFLPTHQDDWVYGLVSSPPVGGVLFRRTFNNVFRSGSRSSA